MKRFWGWIAERLFVSVEPVPAHRAIVVVETPEAPWSLSQVNELRWA